MDIQSIERAVENGREALHDQLSLRRVFGEPIERDGSTVIPVARVHGWGGSGTGWGGGTVAKDAETGGSRGTGRGAAGAFSASPAGVYVIREGRVNWIPASDPDRTIALGCTVAVVALLAGRSIVRTIFERTRAS